MINERVRLGKFEFAEKTPFLIRISPMFNRTASAVNKKSSISVDVNCSMRGFNNEFWVTAVRIITKGMFTFFVSTEL